MAWQKNGTPLTLGSALDDMDITDLTGKNFNVYLIHKILSGSGADLGLTCNDDTGSLYAERGANNGGADATAVSQAELSLQVAGDQDEFTIGYFCWISGEEKLQIAFDVGNTASGAGSVPQRREMVGKYVPSPLTDTFDRVDINNSEAGSYDTSSNLSALGTD